MNMLELTSKHNIWNPPSIDMMRLAVDVKDDVNARQSDQYLYIFQTVPYVDSIYVKYDSDRDPVEVRRFAFHEGHYWNPEDEEFFDEHCIKSTAVSYNGDAIETIYRFYQMIRPEWHVQRYYTNGLKMLDHIYNCIKENTVKEMLYKAGLDELAVHADEMDEINLLSRKPSDLYDGLTMKILRAINCEDGAVLIGNAQNRPFLIELNKKFPEIFKTKLNNAQCRYLDRLIKGKLTVGEAGRLFTSRRGALARIWNHSQFEIFMAMETRDRELEELSRKVAAIDPIYEKYVRNIKFPATDDSVNTIRQLIFYLLTRREEYDRKIRVSNRKREYDWQERGEDYIVRYPQTINDFCRESVYMMNCLMTYVEAYIKNDTTILFMREADDVNAPYITIEIYDNTLMQAYHRFNEDCTSEEADWILSYCKRHGIKTDKFMFDAEVDELF